MGKDQWRLPPVEMDPETRRRYAAHVRALRPPAVCPRLPEPSELEEALNRALHEHDLLEFDARDPSHWFAALDQVLESELSFHIPSEDLRVVRAILTLQRHALTSTAGVWSRFTARLRPDIPETEGGPPRCSPDSPKPGHIDEGDPLNAPPHGTQTRYNSARYRCRCHFCTRANTAYRRERGKTCGDE